ncbi:DUF6022 family protein [Laceyella tengchongensis]
MRAMKPLPQILAESEGNRIDVIAQYINEHITENWQAIFEEKYSQLMDAYKKVGDPAYGTYLNFLFLPIHEQLKESGLKPLPRLPGDLNISREWGNTNDFTDQERWMWSVIEEENGVALGTIVTKVYHDHTQLRVPRPPEVFALTETDQADIVAALSQRSAAFRDAREFRIEAEEYMKNRDA